MRPRAECSLKKVGDALDKCVSVGEDSRLELRGSLLRRCRTGVASKDLSAIELRQSTIRNSKIGLVAYRKKPEFGPADIVGQELTLDNIERPFLLEEDSRMVVGGQDIPPTMEKVERILYGVEYGKKSQ